MRHFVLPAVVALALCGSSALADDATSKDKEITRTPACAVAPVLTGDTLVVKLPDRSVTVRLMGVRAPRPATDTSAAEPYSREATLFLRNLLGGKKVHVQWARNLGEPRGAAPAFVYRAPDGLFVNLEVLRQGYGRVATRFPFEQANLFARQQETAKTAGKGLWSPAPAAPAAAPAPADGKLLARIAALERALRALTRRVERLEAAQEAAAAVLPPQAKERDEKAVIVYISALSRHYHRAGCRYLGAGKTAVSLQEAKKRGYTPCRVCRPPE